jgi:type VII secretion protein EccB
VATGKEQIEALKFARRRMVANLLAPSPTGSDAGAPRPVKTFLASMVLGVVAVATMTVLGYLHPSAPSGWQNGLAVDDTSGAAYISYEGELHPVLNITSAKLILGNHFVKYDVPDSVINAQTIGGPFGIPDAPPDVPPAGQVNLTTWTLCQQAKVPTDQTTVGGQTVLEVGYGQGAATAIAAGSGLIVHNSQGVNYLLYGDYSYQISNVPGLAGTLSGGGSGSTPAVGPWVADSFLDAFYPGAPITDFPSVNVVKDLGKPVEQPDQPTGAVIGNYGVGPNGDDYVETSAGLVQVSQFVFDLYVGNGQLAIHHVADFNPALTQSEITNANAIDERANPADIQNVGNTWPSTKVKIADLYADEPQYSVICVNYAGKFDPSQNETAQLSLWYGTALPHPLATGEGVLQSGSDTLANVVDVLPGHGALSRAVAGGTSLNAGALYLTVETGSRYELPPGATMTSPTTGQSVTTSAQQQLMYAAVAPEPVPENWMALVQVGAALDPDVAGQTPTLTD